MAEVEKKSFKSKLNKYHLGRHHKMERFGILSFILIVGLLVSTGFAYKGHFEKNQNNLNNIAVYSTESQSSLSRNVFNIQGVWTNPKKTTSYILIKVGRDGNTDKKVTLNPDDYMLFVSAKDQHLNKKPAVSMFMFGDTGYIGIKMQSKQRLPNQLLSLIFRIQKNIGDEENVPDMSATSEDALFAKYDQFEFLVNPSAKGCFVSNDLDNDLSPSQLFRLFVSCQTELSIKAEAQKSINTMRRLKDKYAELCRQLSSYKAELPQLPEELKADTFVLSADDEDWVKKYGKKKHLKSYEDAENGNTSGADEIDLSKEKPYRMKSAFTFPGGVDFEWHSMTLNDSSYIKNLIPKNADENTFIDELQKELQDDNNNMNENSFSSYDLQHRWKFTDGRMINFESERSEIQSIVSIIEEISATVSEWYNLKQDYQRVHLKNLLLLEHDANLQDELFATMTESKNNIKFWQQR